MGCRENQRRICLKDNQTQVNKDDVRSLWRVLLPPLSSGGQTWYDPISISCALSRPEAAGAPLDNQAGTSAGIRPKELVNEKEIS